MVKAGVRRATVASGISVERKAHRGVVVAEAAVASDAVSRWVLRGGAFLLPLVFLPNVVDEFVLPKLLLLRLLLGALTILLVLRWFRQRAITWRRTPLDLPLIAFVSAAALSSVFAVNRTVAIFGTYDRWEGLLTIVCYALLFWLAVQALAGQADTRGLTWSVLASGYVVGAVAVVQYSTGLLGGGYFLLGGKQTQASATLANPDFLGIFLAMLIPMAVAKLLSRRSPVIRVLAASIVVVLSLGLVVSFARAPWIGALIGILAVLSLRQGQFHIWPAVIWAVIVVVGFATLAITVGPRSSTANSGFAVALAARVVSITDIHSGTEGTRLKTWGDTLPLIGSRPIFGWGPDTFGLVYPYFQTGSRSGEFFDKAHQEALGVAAAEGILGLAAYAWILVASVRAFWRGRHLRGAVALFGSFIAYQVSIQADFSWIPTAVPFWLLMACAMVTWTPNAEPVRIAEFPRRAGRPVLAASSVLLAILLIPAVVRPYLADAAYYASLGAPDLRQARKTIAQARDLAPYEATYAAVAGNYALNADQNGNPAPNADWLAARRAYENAAALGNFSPEMFQVLALVDQHLGDKRAAVAAAERALELDRYDPYSRALLTKLEAQR